MFTLFRKTVIVIMVMTAACQSPQAKIPVTSKQPVLMPAPDKEISEKNKAGQQPAGCGFLQPDTAVSNIQLRDAESTVKITGNKDKPDENDEYHYYSANEGETLSLTQHAGDGAFAISIFKVSYADKADHGYRQLAINAFTTEKGIKLGMHKKQITDLLGNNYTAIDSTIGFIELYYRLELPCDSKTGLLARTNMPVYYASYKLRRNRLEKFEFGFEYP